MLKQIPTLIMCLVGWLVVALPGSAQVVVDIAELTESSGLAFSTRSDDLLYSHNDSGDSSRLFAFDRRGAFEFEFEIEKAKAKDWEDMCSFEHDGKNWLAVGDIGDNEFKRDTVSIYVVKEPKEKEGDKKRKSEVAYELKVTYPQGPVNSEALAYDPIRHSFLLLTKENLNCTLYEVAIPTDAEDEVRVEAKKIGQHLIPLVTGAAISRDGQSLAICTYGPCCVINRNLSSPNKPWDLAPAELAKKYIQVPPRRQGEAICFSPDGKHVWLTSEHRPTPLIEVKLADSADVK